MPKNITGTFEIGIENYAKDYFKDFGVGSPAFIIGPTFSFFEFSLSKKGIFDDGYDITYSEKLCVPNFNKPFIA